MGCCFVITLAQLALNHAFRSCRHYTGRALQPDRSTPTTPCVFALLLPAASRVLKQGYAQANASAYAAASGIGSASASALAQAQSNGSGASASAQVSLLRSD